jgi:dsDNA-binding SOS-regulon protein
MSVHSSDSETPLAAWLLLSVGIAASRGPATLEDVVATADAIDHTVPTADELSTWIAKLIRDDLISFEGLRYSLTSKGTDFCNRAGAGQGAPWIDQLRSLGDRLPSEVSTKLQSQNIQSRPSKEEAASAINGYLARHKELLATANMIASSRLLERARRPPLERRFMAWVSKLVGRQR